MSIDLSNSYDSASSRLSAIKTYIEVSNSEKKTARSTANSASKSIANTATQLDKIETQQNQKNELIKRIRRRVLRRGIY